MSHEDFSKWIADNGLMKGFVAQRLHISPGQLGRWLSGSCCPQLSHRIAIEKLTSGLVKVEGWIK